ncbi:hypothetical protein Pelo_18386 [Pelomyxa schiedti]|nr:hypothetical protein Pelo_18386 [Pelomyxa schiedti]
MAAAMLAPVAPIDHHMLLYSTHHWRSIVWVSQPLLKLAISGFRKCILVLCHSTQPKQPAVSLMQGQSLKQGYHVGLLFQGIPPCVEPTSMKNYTLQSLFEFGGLIISGVYRICLLSFNCRDPWLHSRFRRASNWCMRCSFEFLFAMTSW